MTPGVIFAAGVAAIVSFMVWVIATEPKRQREANAAAAVTVNGQAATVYTIVDKTTGKSWRAVVIDRGAVIIPGSEQPLPVEKP